MNSIEYTRKLRRVATVSWVGSLVVFLGLAWLHILPFNEFLPFLALLIGTIPIIIFVLLNNAKCELCGGQMKISSGYPRIVYRCKKCMSEIDTGIYSDF
jgi:hypothetical protein